MVGTARPLDSAQEWARVCRSPVQRILGGAFGCQEPRSRDMGAGANHGDLWSSRRARAWVNRVICRQGRWFGMLSYTSIYGTGYSLPRMCVRETVWRERRGRAAQVLCMADYRFREAERSKQDAGGGAGDSPGCGVS